jgi:hypothetical protein
MGFNPWASIFGGIAFGVALFGVRYLRIVTRRSREKPVETVKCAKCGYTMEGLTLPRCPECGALRGFDVPLDQLGLSEEEIRTGFANTARRREELSES